MVKEVEVKEETEVKVAEITKVSEDNRDIRVDGKKELDKTLLDPDKFKKNVENIPLELRELHTWCGFYIDSEGYIDKKPISLVDGFGVGTKDIDRLVSFEIAVKALGEGKIAALGVGLTEGCDITCIDIDCHEDYKIEKFEELNKEVLNQFDSYAETSISGRGTHIFIKGRKPQGFKHVDRYGIIEVYDTARFMIITGDIIEGSTRAVVEYQRGIDNLCEKYLPRVEVYTEQISQGQYEVSEEQILGKLAEFKKGKLFLEGQWESVKKWDKKDRAYVKAYSSQSEADFGFCMLLLYVNGNNPQQAEKIFKASKMYRENKKSSGYIKHQVNQATMRVTKVYDWRKITVDKLEEEIDLEEVILENKVNELIESIRRNGFKACNSQKLNKYMTKYILNFGIEFKDMVDTSLGDYDNGANGVRFYYINNNDLVYIHGSKEWLKWTGKFWDRCYDIDLLDYTERVFNNLKHEAYNKAISSLSELDGDIKEVLEKEAEDLFNYASTSKNKRNCLEMIEFSKSYFIKNSNIKFSANINALNLGNGIYDFDKKELVEHSKEYYQTKISKAVYDEEAKSPLWEKTLERLVPSDEIRRYLQKAVGYTISNKSKEKALFILHGTGNNGKTSFINILLKILGDYSVVVQPQTIMENYANKNNGPRPDLLRLRDKRFAAVSESEENDKLGEGLIKSLTGGGYISCRGLHKEPVEFPANFKLWFDTNHKPVVRGTDTAIWSRLKVIPFTVQIPQSEIDTRLGEKLEKELSGILNWCIKGYEMYIEEGLKTPLEMDLIMNEYSEDMSVMDQWWKECIEILSPEKITKNHKCYTSKELYQSYKHWCDYNGEYKWTQRKFTTEMNKKEACKLTKKVNGFIRYLAIELNELGLHCSDRDTMLAAQFATQYNKLVNQEFTKIAKLEKELEEFEEKEDIKVIPIRPKTIAKGNLGFGGEVEKAKNEGIVYYEVKE